MASTNTRTVDASPTGLKDDALHHRRQHVGLERVAADINGDRTDVGKTSQRFTRRRTPSSSRSSATSFSRLQVLESLFTADPSNSSTARDKVFTPRPLGAWSCM
jgi:hypothetical protein